MTRRIPRLVSLILLLGLAPTAHANLVGLWQFNSNQAVQPDSSIYGNHATPNGDAAWVFDATRNSGAMSFDGNNDFLAAADSASLSITGDITIAAWVNVGPTLGGFNNWRGLMNKGLVGSDRAASYQFFFNQGNLVPVFLRGDGTNIAVYGPGGNAPAQNTWEHWAVTMSGANITMYRNGMVIGTGTMSVPLADNNGPLYIGNRQDSLTDYLGRLDDVAIFDEALNANQISAIRLGDFGGFATVPEASALVLMGFLSTVTAAGVAVRRRFSRRG